MLELTDANFDKVMAEAVANGKPVLIDFWASWCGPCQMLAPMLNEISDLTGDTAVVAKLNIDENPLVTQKFGVRSIPTLLYFGKDGILADKQVGLVPKNNLSEKLERLILS